MTYQPADVSDDLVAEIAARFGLRRPTSWDVLGTSWTTNVRLDIGDRVRVARIHRSWTDRDRLAAIQAVRRQASRDGVPAVVPLPDRHGETIITLAGGSLVELEPYVCWNRRMNSADLLHKGFMTLGRLHDSLAGLDVSDAARTAPHANHLSSAEAANLTRNGADRIRSWVDPVLSAFAGEVIGHVDAVTDAEREFGTAQRIQLVHGDFWDNNVLFCGEALAAVIDFDFMAERWRIDDLALPIYFYLLEPGRGMPTADDRRLVRELVDAYDSGTTRPLSREERLALPLAIARQPAWSVGRWVRTLDEPDARRHAHSAAEEFPIARAVLSELERWQAELSAMIRPGRAPRPWR